jgi:hypothetical protein
MEARLVPEVALAPPEMTILADHPSKSAEESPDLLNLESRLAVVLDILRHRQTNCPITVAIYGDWGTGKTSAMRWLERQLQAWNKQSASDRAGHCRVYPIWFDPWKYHTREDVWRGIISEVILALFRVANLDRQNFVPRMVQAAKQFGAFLGKGFLHALAHTDIKLKADALGSGGELSVKGEMFRDIYDEFDKASQPQKAFLNQFEDALKSWVQSFLDRKGNIFTERIALFIDDLDRCLPDVTLEVLEAIKLYLNIEPLMFVVGIDRTVVAAIVAKHYQENGLPRKSEQYLDKIFQVEIQIPPSERQMHAFLNHQIAFLDESSGGYWNRMLSGESEYKTALESGIRHLARYNPREIKRLLNSALLRGRAAAANPALLTEFSGENLRFAQGVQVFLVQRIVRNKMSNASRLLLEQNALQWFERLSDFLRANLHFKLLESGTASGGWGTRPPTEKQELLSIAQQEYEQIKKERPRNDDGVQLDMHLLEDDLLWSLLRIPFSASVAQFAPGLEARPPAWRLGPRPLRLRERPKWIPPLACPQ